MATVDKKHTDSCTLTLSANSQGIRFEIHDPAAVDVNFVLLDQDISQFDGTLRRVDDFFQKTPRAHWLWPFQEKDPERDGNKSPSKATARPTE